MGLAGIDHITIAPPLLYELAKVPATGPSTTSLFDEPKAHDPPLLSYIDDPEGFEAALRASDNGEDKRKLLEVSFDVVH